MSCEPVLKDGERIDELLWGGLKIIQNRGAPCFSLDAVLLADFIMEKPMKKVIDLGTGTGVIPLLLAAFHPDTEFFALEIMSFMSDMAKRSVKLNSLEDKIKIITADLLRCGDILENHAFDLVISNPPYQKKDRGRISPDPLKAAYQSELYCTLEDIVEKSGLLLKIGGSVALIQRIDRLSETLILLQKYKLKTKRLRFIHAYADREAGLFLIEGEKGYQGMCRVLPPLIIYKQLCEYTDELKKLFTKK